MDKTYCTNPAHMPGDHDASCMPPADPSNANLRLLRAIFGLCPNCNETAPHLCQTDAKGRRQNAIGMLSALYMPDWNGYDLTSTDTEQIAGNISKLAQLGKTARWQGAVKQWAAMVRAADNPYSIRTSFLQGMVYAGHASE